MAQQPQVNLGRLSSRPSDVLWFGVLGDVIRNVPQIEERVCYLCKNHAFKKGKFTGRKMANFMTASGISIIAPAILDILRDMTGRHPTWVYATDTHDDGDVDVQMAHHIMDVLQDIPTAEEINNPKKRREPDGGF